MQRKRNHYIIYASVIVAVIGSFMVTFSSNESIVIHASVYEVAKQFNDLTNWKNWNVHFNDSTDVTGTAYKDQAAMVNSDVSYQLHYINPATVAVTIASQQSTLPFYITASPFRNDSTACIEWTKKTSIFSWLKDAISKTDDRQINLRKLKIFMEDDARKYGFGIHLVPVKDTLILTVEKQVQQNEITKNIRTLYLSLATYVKVNRLPAERNYFYVSLVMDESNKPKLGVGIPVYKKAKNFGPFKYLELPSGGKLVTGYYEGEYADKERIYAAINRYIIAKELKKAAQPLEQYDSRYFVLTDTSMVHMQLYYPVY